MAPITYAICMIPDIDTGSDTYRQMFYRKTFNTTFFPLSKLILWMTCLFFGFSFVVVFNLDNKRSNPWHSRDGSFKDIKKMMALGLLAFIYSGIIFLRSENDLSSNCESWGSLYHYITDTTDPTCHKFSVMERFGYNYGFVVLFFVGLNFTHMDVPPFNTFIMTWEMMKNWSTFLWCLFVTMISFFIGSIGYVFYMYYLSYHLTFYIVSFILYVTAH